MDEDGNYNFSKPQIFKLTYDMSILCTTLLFFFGKIIKTYVWVEFNNYQEQSKDWEI